MPWPGTRSPSSSLTTQRFIGPSKGDEADGLLIIVEATMAPSPELSISLEFRALHSGQTVKALASVKPHKPHFQMVIFSNIRSNLLRRCAKDIDGAGYPGAAEIMRQTYIGVFHLVWVSSPKLLYDFVNLSKAGRANRVPFGL